MEDTYNKLVELDRAGDLVAIHEFIRTTPLDLNWIVQIVARFLNAERLSAAYVVASPAVAAGAGSPVLSIAMAFGGILLGNAHDEAVGIAALTAQTDAMSPDLRAMIVRDMLNPAIHHMCNLTFSRRDHDLSMRVLEILKAGHLTFRAMFDWTPQPQFDLEATIGAGRARAKLVDYTPPPADIPRQQRRCVVAMRKYWSAQDPTTRPHELGPRIVASAQAYGWDTQFFGMLFHTVLDDYANLAAMCREQRTEVLILDDDAIASPLVLDFRDQMLVALKQDLPELKVVLLYHDPWVLSAETLKAASVQADGIWTINPAMPVWRDPVFDGKILSMPVPVGGCAIAPRKPLAQSKASFVGGINAYNYHRLFWWAAIHQHDLPIDWSLSTHLADGLPPLESFGAYMQRVADTGCSLNFSMRHDLSRTVTGRCSEAVFAGTLLVQERTEDMDYFLIPGEHYLTFSTFGELQSIIEFIRDNPEQAEEIRRNGHEFAHARYSDDKLIGYVDKLLFFK